MIRIRRSGAILENFDILDCQDDLFSMWHVDESCEA